jgi:hypothetical protein
MFPWAMIVRLLRSITEGRTERPDGGDVSLSKATSEHSAQGPMGALMAFWTSVRLKYICAPAGMYSKEPGKPRTSQSNGPRIFVSQDIKLEERDAYRLL